MADASDSIGIGPKVLNDGRWDFLTIHGERGIDGHLR